MDACWCGFLYAHRDTERGFHENGMSQRHVKSFTGDKQRKMLREEPSPCAVHTFPMLAVNLDCCFRASVTREVKPKQIHVPFKQGSYSFLYWTATRYRATNSFFNLSL